MFKLLFNKLIRRSTFTEWYDKHNLALDSQIKLRYSNGIDKGSWLSLDMIMSWANNSITDWLLINKKVKEVKFYPSTTTKRHMAKNH